MEETKDTIRLNTVRRIDPHVKAIVDSAARTALYTYEQAGESWSKTDVEGTVMVYSREAPPHNMITIINRLNKSNFIEPLTPECDFQVKPPYLLFRNIKGVIYGIWFSEQQDVHRISTAVGERINSEPQSNSQPAATILADPAVAVARSAGGDILTLLSKAQGEYESRRHEPTRTLTTVDNSNSDVVRPAPLKAQSGDTHAGPNVVADFLAKVGGNVSGMSGTNSSGGGGSSGNADSIRSGTALHSPASSAVPTSNTSSTSTNPVLQKLFQGAAAVGGQATVAVSIGPSASGASAPITIPGAASQSHSATITSSVPGSAPMSLQELEGRLKENLHIGSASKDDEIATPVQQYNKQSHGNYQQTSNPEQSSLLAPQVFTSSHKVENLHQSTPSEDSPATRTLSGIYNQQKGSAVDVQPLNGSPESVHDNLLHSQSHVTPLTQEQLVQAFTVLLKKDDFVHQLHEAYVQALNQSLKGCL